MHLTPNSGVAGRAAGPPPHAPAENAHILNKRMLGFCAGSRLDIGHDLLFFKMGSNNNPGV